MYNYKVTLTTVNKIPFQENFRCTIKANSITEVITRVRNLLDKYTIKSIMRRPLNEE